MRNKAVACFALALLLLSFPASGHGAEKVYELRMTHLTTTMDPIHLGYDFFKRTIEEKSNGRIKVTIFPNKQLSNSDNENAEKVQQNIVQMSSAPTSSLAAIGKINEYKVFDYAFLFANNQELYKVIDSEIGQELSAMLEKKTGIKTFGGFNLGWCVISTNKGPIESPASLKGLKIRTMNADLMMEAIRAFGANPTIVNYGELFTACQQGTVDGIMTSSTLYVSDRFYEVQKYMGCTNAMPIFHIPMVNAKWYNSLPADLKKAFDDTVPLYLEAVRQYEEDYQAAALKKLKEFGMEVKEYTPEERQVFVDAAAYISRDKADIAGKEIVAKVKAMLGKQ
ncbi:putative TRAP dicarboxylate transporter, DctP subunit [uncultured delta proteobacterium]|uniref:Putative TRAP dicarboxylate transporter, DctP subunit n=1 Tax=uncultured delta proteobacterium TaxID=34034 RepID=A0A212J8Z6_9DELT|nr:putative TRAP dicarboxylate transporter, DctP subunit [uncultured delta proteobacterium]